MKNLLLPLCVLLALSPIHASTEKLNQALNTLKGEFQAEIAAAKSKEAKARDVLTQLDPKEFSWENPYPQWLELIQQIERSSQSPQATEACKQIISGIAEHKKEQFAKLKEDLFNSLRTALQAGLSATKASDLDAPILEVAKWEQQLSTHKYQTNKEHPTLSTLEMENVNRILTTIQDTFLSASSKKARREEVTLFQKIQNSGGFYDGLNNIIPRSELLSKLDALSERISPVPKILTENEFQAELRKMLAEVKKFEDLEAMFQRIDDLFAQQKNLGGYNGGDNITYKLTIFSGMYENLRSGGAINLGRLDVDSEDAIGLQSVKNLLIRFALPRLLGEPEGLTLSEGESTEAFLKRAMAQALDKSNWPLLSRAVSVADDLRITQIATANDENNMQNFIGAVNLHKAKQYAPAVTAYIQVLKSGWQIVPADRIGEMLAEIEKQDPAAYKEGLNPAPRLTASPGRVIIQPPPTMPKGPDTILDGIGETRPSPPPPSKPALILPAKPKPPSPEQKPTSPAAN